VLCACLIHLILLDLIIVQQFVSTNHEAHDTSYHIPSLWALKFAPRTLHITYDEAEIFKIKSYITSGNRQKWKVRDT